MIFKGSDADGNWFSPAPFRMVSLETGLGDRAGLLIGRDDGVVDKDVIVDMVMFQF
jgi:hypothetical protein